MPFYNLDPNRPGERMACELERLDDYRVLRRLPRPDEIWCRSMPAPENVIKLGIVDCETTGLDPERDKMIEFAVGMLSIDTEHGDVVGVSPPQAWLEDPSEDLSIEVERLTHITSDLLVGRRFPDVEIMKAMAGIDALVAHNAKFDRAFVTQRFEALADLPWICSMSEVDWLAQGWSGSRSISALLIGAGFFFPDAHRAAADVWATTCLLAQSAADGRAVATQMVETARRPTSRLYATRAPFECKNVLKMTGYRWSPERRAWWIEGDQERLANEQSWLKQLCPTCKPELEQLSWLNRHAVSRNSCL